MDLLSFLVSSVNFIVVLMVDLNRELDILNYLGSNQRKKASGERITN